MASEQREYIILGDLSYHSKGSGDEFFMANLEPLRYIDLETPTIIKKPDVFSLNWYVSDKKNIEAPYMSVAV